jgi:hypothetical protein
MNDSGDTSPRAAEPTPEPPRMPASRQSIKYGKPPIDENASGRRARLRHPARGAARN